MRFHTNLPVSDVTRTRQFYEVLFGAPPVKEKADYLKFLPEGLGLNIAFSQAEAPIDFRETLHLGFELSSAAELREAERRLTEAGLSPTRRETFICCYANQDKMWITDPDGYKWELYVLLEDTEKKIDAQSSCCGTGVCGTSAASGCC